MRIILNTDTKLVEEINQKLDESLEKYGFQYCPCSLIHDNDHICICKDFREQQIGMCHCGKFIKVK